MCQLQNRAVYKVQVLNRILIAQEYRFLKQIEILMHKNYLNQSCSKAKYKWKNLQRIILICPYFLLMVNLSTKERILKEVKIVLTRVSRLISKISLMKQLQLQD